MATTEPNVAPITIALRARAAEETAPGLVKLLTEAAQVLESYREGWLLRGQRANNCQAAQMAAEARIAELEASLRSVADILNDESLPVADAAATAYRLCDEALSALKGSAE